MSRSYNRAMAKPPITISCECGERRDLAYGERWECETCGRIWNTQQIPRDEYDELLRQVRRRKLEAFGAAFVGIAVMLPLIAVVSTKFIAVVPIAMAGWLFVFLPAWRRRYRRTAAAAPRWQLHPE